MIWGALILIVTTGLFFISLELVCQRLLRREFAREYFKPIVKANCLEFQSIRIALEDFGFAGEYPRVAQALKYDFLVLTYLLKNAANLDQRYTREDWLLMVYFHVGFTALAARHLLRLREEAVVLNLTAILKYIANVVGEHVNTMRYKEAASPRFPSLRSLDDLIRSNFP